MSGVEFELSLVDAVTGPAADMAASLGSVEQQGKTLESAMRSLEKQMTKATALGDTEKVSELQGKYEAFGGSLEKLGPQASSAGGGMGDLGSEIEMMVDPVALATMAIAALGAAFTAIVVGGSALAIQATEAKNKMTALFDALGEGKVSGAQTIAMLDELGNQTGLTTKQLAPLAQSFMAMGVTGVDQLRSLTLAAASANAMIAGAGDTFTNTFKKLTVAADLGQPFKLAAKGAGSLAAMGLTVEDMAKRMGMSADVMGAKLKRGMNPEEARKFGAAMQDALINKGAGPLAVLGNSMGAIKDKFVENVSKMFQIEEVDGFMAGVRDLFSIFEDSSKSGKAMKAGIGGAFSEIFKAAKLVLPYVKHFLLDLAIAGLKIYIAFKPVIKHFKDLFGSAKGGDAVTYLLDKFAATLVEVGQATAVVVDAFLTVYGWWSKLQDGAANAGKAFRAWILGVVADVENLLANGKQIATDFVQGLVDGITGGVSKVVDAAKNLAKGAKDAVTGFLGIKSPSTVMMQMGGHTAGGFADGMTAGIGDVKAASADMGSAAMGGIGNVAAPAASGGASGGSGGGSGVTVNVEPGAIVIQGAGAGAEELTETAISLIFERVALAAGI